MWRDKIQISRKCGFKNPPRRTASVLLLHTKASFAKHDVSYEMRISYERNSIVNPNPDPQRYSISHIIFFCNICIVYFFSNFTLGSETLLLYESGSDF